MPCPSSFLVRLRQPAVITGMAAALWLALAGGAAQAGEVYSTGHKCNNREGAGREFSQDHYVYFDTDSSRIRRGDLDKIRHIYGLATGRQAQQICLFGKSSKQGDAKANAALSKKRSANVARAFEELGWPSSRIAIEYEGEAWGWLEETLTSDSQADRRVRIRLSM